MAQESNENSYTAPVRQQKSQKEMTMATGHTTSLAQIDVTKPLSIEEQALITSNENSLADQNIGINGMPGYYPGKFYPEAKQTENETEGTSYIVKEGEEISTIAKDNGITSEELINANLDKLYGTDKKYFKAGEAITIPEKKAVVKEDTEGLKNTEEIGIPQATEKPVPEIKPEIEIKEKPAKVESAIPESDKKVEEPVNEEKKAEGYISSFIGEYTSAPDKSKIANLGKDVAFVQQHLNRLGILSDADFNAEKVTTLEEINKNQIPKTIEAIDWFQSKALHYNTRYGYVDPTGGTIKQLVSMTVEQKDAKFLEYTKKKEAAEKKATEDKAKAAEEAKRAKAEAERLEKIKKQKEAKEALIKNEPATKENAAKHYKRLGSLEAFGKFLKDYTLLNPQFVLKAYELLWFGEPDNLTRAIMYSMTNEEIAKLPNALDKFFYESLDAGWTVDEEYALMDKLRTGKEKNKGTEKSEIKIDDKTLGNAKADLKTLRKTLNNQLSGSVGEKGINYPLDVKMVAQQLKDKAYNPGVKALENGICDDTFKIAIGEFQKSINAGKKNYVPDKKIDIGGTVWKALFDVKGTYKSGIKDIHAGRRTVNVNLVDSEGKGIKEAVGDADSKSFGEKVKNNIEDVKYVSQLLKDKGFTVTNKNLVEGKCDATFITAIKAFEKANKKTQYGVITKDGSNIKILQGSSYSIGKISYNSGVHDKNGVGTATDSYYKKLDVLEKNLKISKNKDNEKVLSIARKAATDDKYFAALTKDVTSKLALTSKMITDNGINLSPVLIERMRKYHKFLSAAGLFKGNMTSSEGGGVRSDKTAHIWCGQWIIAAEGAGSDSGASYVAQTKNILLEMYNEQKNNKNEYIIDVTKNKWAKKEHFTEDKKGNVTMDWSKIKSFVATIEGGRTSYTAPANSGYPKDDLRRRPVPPGSPSVTNHKTGEAIDINATSGFQNKYDSLLDMIALNFGVVRAGGSTEWWHFELTDLKLSKSEEKIAKD